MKTTRQAVLFLTLLAFSNVLSAQGFVIDQFKPKQFQSVNAIPNHGYAIAKVVKSQVVVEVYDLEGKEILKFGTPHKMLKTTHYRADKPKVFYNGSSYCVVAPMKMGKQAVYTFDLNGKNIGSQKLGNKVMTVVPFQEGYFIRTGGSFSYAPEAAYTNELKTKWKYKPAASNIEKYDLAFVLAAGENITSKMLTFGRTEGTNISEEFLYSYPAHMEGVEDRYLFERSLKKGVDNEKRYGIVCLDKNGKELFGDYYADGERKFLCAVSHNKEIYALFRTYPKKGAESKSLAEIVKYNEKGEKVERLELPQEKFPVMSDYMHFYMEKTPDGIAVLSDARAHFYSIFLDENLSLQKKYAFEGKSYKRNNKPPKMSAIGSFPYRSMFSGVNSQGEPYVMYLDKKMGKETVRCTAFTGKSLFSAETASQAEDHIEMYYAGLSPFGSLKVDYGDVVSHHEIYCNLIKPVNGDMFSIISFLDTKKTLICKNYKIESGLDQ